MMNTVEHFLKSTRQNFMHRNLGIKFWTKLECILVLICEQPVLWENQVQTTKIAYVQRTVLIECTLSSKKINSKLQI